MFAHTCTRVHARVCVGLVQGRLTSHQTHTSKHKTRKQTLVCEEPRGRAMKAREEQASARGVVAHTHKYGTVAKSSQT